MNDNDILLQNTLYDVDDFYHSPRDLLWCKKCERPIEVGGLQYVNIQNKPFFRINSCYFHRRCYDEKVCLKFCSRPNSPLIRLYKGKNISNEMELT